MISNQKFNLKELEYMKTDEQSLKFNVNFGFKTYSIIIKKLCTNELFFN
jgi:hypothetical protein